MFPLLRGHLCQSKQKNSAAKQNCCLRGFFHLREGGRNIKINPLPPQILPLSWSIKNILEPRPCLCSSMLKEDFCQDTDPLWILQMSLHLSLFERQKNPLLNLHLVPCNPELSEDLLLNRGSRVIYEITAELYCVLVTNCKDIPWDVSSNEHGTYYTTGKRGA